MCARVCSTCWEHELCTGSRATQEVWTHLGKHPRICLAGCCACRALRVRGGRMCHLPSEVRGRAHLLCQPGSTLAGPDLAVASPSVLVLGALEKAGLPWRCASLCAQKKRRGFLYCLFQMSQGSASREVGQGNRQTSHELGRGGLFPGLRVSAGQGTPANASSPFSLREETGQWASVLREPQHTDHPVGRPSHAGVGSLRGEQGGCLWFRKVCAMGY